LSQDQKDFLDKYTKGNWSLNPSTGLVDIQGDFNCFSKNINDLQGIRFGAVTGSFDCDSNNLKSLAGAPQTVGGSFYCSSNNLTSLAGAPQTVGGYFYCSYNNLTSLAGAPETVGGNFVCNDNKLTSLAGAPETVGGDFYCSSNNLTSLTGAPETVGEDFYCNDNKLTSLAGAPETVGGGFYSGDLEIPEGQWGLETFIDLMKTGTSKQKQLVAPLVDPKVIQQQIDENPEGMLVKLKGYLKHPFLQGLKWPQRLEQEKDLLSDLEDVGL
jgi:hypothetical protein